MRKAFTSPEFEADPDSFRYLAWTNRRIHEVNEMIRRTINHKFAKVDGVAEWTASLPSRELRLRNDEGEEKTVQMPTDNTEFQRVIARIKDEAAEARIRWKHLHEFQQSLAQLQSVYALTVHRTQGSTFGTAFVDLPDIRRRERDNLLKAQQMLYVAVTRPSKRLVISEQRTDNSNA